jgi:hypothetical protein
MQNYETEAREMRVASQRNRVYGLHHRASDEDEAT